MLRTEFLTDESRSPSKVAIAGKHLFELQTPKPCLFIIDPSSSIDSDLVREFLHVVPCSKSWLKTLLGGYDRPSNFNIPLILTLTGSFESPHCRLNLLVNKC